jgi:signal transduction histidine kinase
VNKASVGVARALRLYVAIVVAYVALIGWWVFFFSGQAARLQTRLHGVDLALDDAQLRALDELSAGDARMFLFEGGFVFLLLLGSVILIVRALRQEAALGRQQRNFLSAVTHELRSPLAAIKLYVDSLLGGRVSGDKAQRYLRHAKQDVERLETLVEDVLTARRLDEGRLPYAHEPLDLAELLREALPRFQSRYADGATAPAAHAAAGDPGANPKPVELRFDADGAALVDGDRSGLLQIVDNLISNAVKYGEGGGPIELGVRRVGARVQLHVRDRGPGLPTGESARLTEPFVRGGEERVRTRPGVGLGLFIVREIVAAHGGRFRLSSGGADGPGTTALVDLPAWEGELP